MRSELLQIGVIRRAHGLRGLLRVQLHDPASEALLTLQLAFVGPDEGALLPRRVKYVQDLGGGMYFVGLEGIADRDGAEAVQGQCLYAARADLPSLAQDEFYLADLVGCTVVLTGDPEGPPVGTVSEVQSNAGSDLLVVQREGRQEALVPMLPAFVVGVDVAGRRIEIDPPEGLLDLDLPGEKTAGRAS